MPASTTTFEERLARIHERAAQDEMNGYVEPGVSENPTPGGKRKKPRRSGGGVLLPVLGGLATSFALVGVGAVVLLNGAGDGSFEDIVASLLLSSD